MKKLFLLAILLASVSVTAQTDPLNQARMDSLRNQRIQDSIRDKELLDILNPSGVSLPQTPEPVIVADTTKTISLSYGTLFGDYDVDVDNNLVATGPMIAFRGLYLIDKNGVVRHQLINDLPLGRNVDDTIRMVDALQFFEENGEVCPANWTKGAEGLKDTHAGVAEYLAKH